MEPVFFSLATELSTSHEFLIFNDGHLEIELILYQVSGNASLDHCSLTKEQTKDLLHFLDKHRSAFE